MGYITDKKKEQARRTDLIKYLQVHHPALIFEKSQGEYAFTERTCITFYRGRDGIFRYCDHKKRMEKAVDYHGDGIRFLQEYVQGYDFPKAVSALCDFDDSEDSEINAEDFLRLQRSL